MNGKGAEVFPKLPTQTHPFIHPSSPVFHPGLALSSIGFSGRPPSTTQQNRSLAAAAGQWLNPGRMVGGNTPVCLILTAGGETVFHETICYYTIAFAGLGCPGAGWGIRCGPKTDRQS